MAADDKQPKHIHARSRFRDGLWHSIDPGAGTMGGSDADLDPAAVETNGHDHDLCSRQIQVVQLTAIARPYGQLPAVGRNGSPISELAAVPDGRLRRSLERTLDQGSNRVRKVSGSGAQSGSPRTTAAMVSVTSSPSKVRRPVSIS